MNSLGQKAVYPQLDFVKGIAIIAVLVLHTLNIQQLYGISWQFHIQQAVPIFFIVIGITSLITFGGKNLFSIAYFRRRFERIVFPFLLMLLALIVVKLCYPDFEIHWGLGIIIGALPHGGPGNYFVTIMFQFIFVAPFIMWLYRKSPIIALLVLFGGDLAFELVAPHFFTGTNYLYDDCIFRYFAAIGLGLWIGNEFLSTSNVSFKTKRNVWIWCLIPFSIWYLVEAQYTKQPFSLFKPEWSSQNIISFAYAALLVVLLIKLFQYIPKSSLKPLLRLGNSSYHIFLVQIVYFTSLRYVFDVYAPNNLALHLTINIVVCCLLGLAFQAIEQRALRMLKIAFTTRAGQKLALKQRK